MIDWGSPNWGGGVTLAADGSWVEDRHSESGGHSHALALADPTEGE